MSSVPVPSLGAPAQARTGARTAALVVAGVAAVAVALAAAWPSARDAPAPAPAPAAAAGFDGIVAGAKMQQATCAEWLAAAPAQRDGAVGALAATVGAASTTGGVGVAMSRERAVRLFDARCAQPGAESFLLYEMYTRAAAFGGA